MVTPNTSRSHFTPYWKIVTAAKNIHMKYSSCSHAQNVKRHEPNVITTIMSFHWSRYEGHLCIQNCIPSNAYSYLYSYSFQHNLITMKPLRVLTVSYPWLLLRQATATDGTSVTWNAAPTRADLAQIPEALAGYNQSGSSGCQRNLEKRVKLAASFTGIIRL